MADSDEESSNFIAELLSLYNYEVIHAPTAAEAAHLAASLQFDSLIVSLDMPNGGFTLSQSLREIDGYDDVPVLFSTSEVYDYALLMEAQFYGALFLHMKPFNECELLAQLSTMVRLKILRDEIKGRLSELDRLASTDPLTGLYNRRMFFRRMDEEVARAGRTAAPMCLIYVDIDYFKVINDDHGHAAGDAVLQQVARTMTRIIRRGDVLGRIGGEEFLILLPDTPGSAGQRIAERLRQRVEHATIIYGGHKIKVTISAGVFHAADPVGLSLDEMVKVADQALYEAKETGRNRVVYRGEEENNNS